MPSLSLTEELMHMARSPEMSLPDVVSSQAEQDDTHLVQASQQGDQDLPA